MKQAVVLTICGKQNYPDQEPEIIELTTEGTMERTANGWRLTYAESDLTGLEGVRTTFALEPEKVTLSRSGHLSSEMVFQEGVAHESLYQMEFGALMISVCAKRVAYDLTDRGGTVDLLYSIEIEQSAAGMVEYHLDIRVK